MEYAVTLSYASSHTLTAVTADAELQPLSRGSCTTTTASSASSRVRALHWSELSAQRTYGLQSLLGQIRRAQQPRGTRAQRRGRWSWWRTTSTTTPSRGNELLGVGGGVTRRRSTEVSEVQTAGDGWDTGTRGSGGDFAWRMRWCMVTSRRMRAAMRSLRTQSQGMLTGWCGATQ